jgi:hypothetical protein
MSDNDRYNGWANRETWLINVWLGDIISGDGQQWDAGTLEEWVEEFVDAPTEGLLADLCGLWRVDWHELAEHFNDVEGGE